MNYREKIIEIRDSVNLPEKILTYLNEEIDFFDSQGEGYWDNLDGDIDEENPNNILIFYLLGKAKKPKKYKHSYSMSDPPDIDCDLESEGREYAISYLKKKYGEKRVLQIGTIGQIKIKSAIIDISRVLGIDPSDVYEVTTSMEDLDESATMDELKKSYPKLSEFLEEYPEIENHLHKLLGSFRNYCLARDTKINVGKISNNGRVKHLKIRIDKLFRKQKDYLLEFRGPTFEKLFTNRYECVKAGKDKILEIKMSDGSKIRCNEHHTWFTNQGLKKVKDFNLNTKILRVD